MSCTSACGNECTSKGGTDLCDDRSSDFPSPGSATAEGQEKSFEWHGVTFTYNFGNFPGFRSDKVDGDMWHAAVHVDGWRWTARLNVNGGTATGVGTTPWQALDAAVVEWQTIVERLAQSLKGEAPKVQS